LCAGEAAGAGAELQPARRVAAATTATAGVSRPRRPEERGRCIDLSFEIQSRL
jgi:hypothetical protein